MSQQCVMSHTQMRHVAHIQKSWLAHNVGSVCVLAVYVCAAGPSSTLPVCCSACCSVLQYSARVAVCVFLLQYVRPI